MTKPKFKRLMWSGAILVGAISIATTAVLLLNNKHKKNKKIVNRIFNELSSNENINYFYRNRLNEVNQLIAKLNEEYKTDLFNDIMAKLSSLEEISELIKKDSEIDGKPLDETQIGKLDGYWDKEYASGVESMKNENGYWAGLEEKHQKRINELILQEKNASGKSKVDAREAFKNELVNDSDLSSALKELKSKIQNYKSKIEETIEPLKDNSKVKSGLQDRLNTNNINKLKELLADSEKHRDTYLGILNNNYDLDVDLQDANVERWAEKLKNSQSAETQYSYLIKNDLNTNNFKRLQIEAIDKTQLNAEDVKFIEKHDNLNSKKDNRFWLRLNYQIIFPDYGVEKDTTDKVYILNYDVTSEQESDLNNFKANFKQYYDSLNISEDTFKINGNNYYKKSWIDQSLPIIKSQWVATKAKVAKDWNDYKAEIYNSDNFRKNSDTILKSLKEYIEGASSRFDIDLNEWMNDRKWTYERYLSNEKLVKDFMQSYDIWKNLLLNEKELKEKYESKKVEFKFDNVNDSEWKKTVDEFFNSGGNKYEINDKLFYYDRDQKIDDRSVFAYDLNVPQIYNSNNYSKNIENENFLSVLRDFVTSYDNWINFYENNADRALIKQYFETDSLFMWNDDSKTKISRDKKVLSNYINAIYNGTDFKNLEEKINLFIKKRKDIIDYISGLDATFESSKSQMRDYVLGNLTKDITVDEWEAKKQIISDYINLYGLGLAKYNAEFKRLEDQNLDQEKINSLKNRHKYEFDFNLFLEISKKTENASEKLVILNNRNKNLYTNIQIFIDSKKKSRDFKDSNIKKLNYIHKHNNDWTIEYAKDKTTINDVKLENNSSVVISGNKYQLRDENNLLWDITNKEVIPNNLIVVYELYRKFENPEDELVFSEKVSETSILPPTFANLREDFVLLQRDIDILIDFINMKNYIYYDSTNEKEFFDDIIKKYQINNLDKWKGNDNSGWKYFNNSELFDSLENIKNQIIERKNDYSYFYNIFGRKSEIQNFINEFRTWISILKQNKDNKWSKEFSERVFETLDTNQKNILVNAIAKDHVNLDRQIINQTVGTYVINNIKSSNLIKAEYNKKYSNISNFFRFEDYQAQFNLETSYKLNYNDNNVELLISSKKGKRASILIPYSEALKNSVQGKEMYDKFVAEFNRLAFMLYKTFWYNRTLTNEENIINKNNNKSSYYDVNDAYIRLGVSNKYKFSYSNDYFWHPDFNGNPFKYILGIQLAENPRQFFADDKKQGYYDNKLSNWMKFQSQDWNNLLEFRSKLQEKYNKAKSRLQSFNYDLIIKKDLWDKVWETSPLPFGKRYEKWNYSHKGLKSYSLVPHSNGWESPLVPLYDGYNRPLTIQNLILHGDNRNYYSQILKDGLILDEEIKKWNSSYKLSLSYNDAIKK
ncbi:hypothetical protein HGG64_00550 [Mycoplasma phocoeninasale]|uniref:Uncharacterized protein n=1 Tax=Mycoplasma phocoeninasale TaxID=2726117 RepID=A0A858U1C4_9MOLU|nr:hypothetical protein [Mycoplasma phocoeninasale]QJG66212.1 hypothetical protein HGG64_00550 [Mycoplasma phocoeninasale]